MKDSLTYEKAVKKLEETVYKLEKGELSLDESLALFEQGTKLSAYCYEKLDSAKQTIASLTEQTEGDSNE